MGVGSLWKESSTDARWTLSEQEELEEADWKLSIPISSPTFIFLLQFGDAWSTAAMDLAVLSDVTERRQGWTQCCAHCRSTCAAHIALLLQRFTRLDRIELLAGDEGEIWTDSAFLAISYHPHNGISFGGTKLG